MCLPQYLGREIYAKIHFNSDAHVTNDNLRAIFDASFYTPNSSEMVKQLLQSCIVCRLNRNVYKRSTSGEFREFQNDLTVGAIWICDIAHLPREKKWFQKRTPIL